MNKQLLERIENFNSNFVKFSPEDRKKAVLRATRDMAPYRALLTDITAHKNIFEHLDVLEIGVRRGVSTKAMLSGLLIREGQGLGTGHLYSMDKNDRAHSVMGGTDDMRKNWTFILGRSSEVSWDRKIDVLMIDGDHSLDGVKADWDKYEPFVKPGGLIIMHDVQHPGFRVKDFWETIEGPKIILDLNQSGLGLVTKPAYEKSDN